jgi:hypothetical protein
MKYTDKHRIAVLLKQSVDTTQPAPAGLTQKAEGSAGVRKYPHPLKPMSFSNKPVTGAPPKNLWGRVQNTVTSLPTAGRTALKGLRNMVFGDDAKPRGAGKQG